MSDIVEEIIELIESYSSDSAASDMAGSKEAVAIELSMQSNKTDIREKLQSLRTQLAEATQKLEEARKAVKAMVEDGWLMHGPEGMSEPQQICYDVYQAIEQGKGGDDAN
jgi:DNA-binding transcriptional MerR regulator